MSPRPPVAPADVVRRGKERARTGPWRADTSTALLAPVPDAPLPSAAFASHCAVVLAGRGYRRVLTTALSPLEQAGFLQAGFHVERRLRLLGVDLDDRLEPLPGGLPLRRVRASMRPRVLEVDGAAFTPFWRFDAAALADAVAATPRTRLRAALGPAGVVGYAICGRAGSRGFVQRLAVDPAAQGAGTGRRLLLDGLHWLRRRDVGRAVVNTQEDNWPALALYRSVGFTDEPIGLAVLALDLPVGAGAAVT